MKRAIEPKSEVRKRPQKPVVEPEFTARENEVRPPPAYDAQRIKTLRQSLNVSQPVFAGMLNVSGSTVRAWEQGQRQPDGPSLRLLEFAEHYPHVLLSKVAPATKRRKGS